MYRTLIIDFCLRIAITSFAQTNDTMVVYDYQSKTMSLIPPVAYDTNVTFDHTSSFVGTLGNQISLSLTPPTTNLFSGSNFSDLARAELFFDVTNYPIRTAISLGLYHQDTLRQKFCSGILIGKNLVLTSGHAVYWNGTFWGDSISAAPAYDNGQYQTSLPTSVVEKAYFFLRIF